MRYGKNIFNNIFDFEEGLASELLGYSKVTFQKGEVLVRQHSYIRMLPLLLEGTLRVYKQTEDREILYYYMEEGGTCGLALGACLEGKMVESEIVASERSLVVFVPLIKVEEWQRTYPSWNRFIIHTLAYRQQQLLETFGDIAFSKMEKRIQDYLSMLIKSRNSPIICITHQELANELGTTRVVISRILKTLELRGVVELLRGAIKIKQLAAV